MNSNNQGTSEISRDLNGARLPSDGKIYKCNHCNLIFPTRNKLFDHIHGRNGAESCLEAIKEGVKQEIQTKRVLMHIGYYSNSNVNNKITLNHDMDHDQPVYSFDSGKDILIINTDHVMKILLKALKNAIVEMSNILKLSEKDVTLINTKLIESISRASGISSRTSYHFRLDRRISASSDVISCSVPSFTLATSTVNKNENFINRLNRHIKQLIKTSTKNQLQVFSFIPFKTNVHAIHDRKF